MDANLERILHIRIKRTMEALEKNNMKALYVPSSKEAAIAFIVKSRRARSSSIVAA